jgi:hypothetical protein
VSAARRRVVAATQVTQRFTTATALDGHEVVDRDGRPVAVRATEDDARFEAAFLNNAASLGRVSLATAIANL